MLRGCARLDRLSCWFLLPRSVLTEAASTGDNKSSGAEEGAGAPSASPDHPQQATAADPVVTAAAKKKAAAVVDVDGGTPAIPTPASPSPASTAGGDQREEPMEVQVCVGPASQPGSQPGSQPAYRRLDATAAQRGAGLGCRHARPCGCTRRPCRPTHLLLRLLRLRAPDADLCC